MLYIYNMSIPPKVPTNAISEQQDRVFRALASHHRRAILDVLRDQPLTTGALCGQFPELDRCTVMQHLKVLESADLIIAERKGRERWNHLDVLPITMIVDRWIGQYARSAVDLLATLKSNLEG